MSSRDAHNAPPPENFVGVHALDAKYFFGPRKDPNPPRAAPRVNINAVNDCIASLEISKARERASAAQPQEQPRPKRDLSYVAKYNPGHSAAPRPQDGPHSGAASTIFIPDDDASSSMVGSMFEPYCPSAVDGGSFGMESLAHSRLELSDSCYQEPRGAVYKTNLPVYKRRVDILKHVDAHQVTLIQGGTGSGKSTQVPLFLMDFCQMNGKHCNIVVTQPRRIAAISLANIVNQWRGFTDIDAGKQIGYQVSFDRKVTETTKLTYVTTGILLRTLVSEKGLGKYSHIILDEVHERDYETDFVMLLVKRFREANPKVRIILMSATLNSDIFLNYFKSSHANQIIRPPCIEVEGKQYQVVCTYLEHLANSGKFPQAHDLKFEMDNPEIPPQKMDLAVSLIKHFESMECGPTAGLGISGWSGGKGAVLVFLPGQADILDMCNRLNRENNEKLGWVILMLHSELAVADQRRVFDPVPSNKRKIVLSTNIAESSITVTDIVYVVDFCLSKEMRKDDETGFQSLRLCWASQSNCTQRRGRAGRVANGKCYRLIRKEDFDMLPEYADCELRRAPLEPVILQIKELGEQPCALLSNAIEPPYANDISDAIISLKRLGALTITMKNQMDQRKVNENDGNLTFVGRVLAKLSCDVRLGKLVIYGWLFGVLDEAATIAACLSERGLFVNPLRQQLEAYRLKRHWARGTNSDLYACLYVYEEYNHTDLPTVYDQRRWCYDQFVEHKKLRTIEELKKKILTCCQAEGFDMNMHHFSDMNTPKSRIELLNLAICAAFYPNYFKTPSDAISQNEVSRQLCGHPPFSTVQFSGIPMGMTVDDLACFRTQLKALFESCLRQCSGAHLYIDSSKLYVVFQRAATSAEVIDNSILPSVYLALFMDRVRDRNLVLDGGGRVDTTNDASAGLFTPGHALDGADPVTASNSRALILKGYENEQRIVEIPMTETLLEVHPSFVHSCCRISCQKADSRTQRLIQSIQSAISDMMADVVQLSRRQRVKGALCLAPFEGEYYRAVIEEVGKDHARVYFVDYGNSEDVDIPDLKEISQNSAHVSLMEIPFQAIHICPLNLIAPREASSDPTEKQRCKQGFNLVHDIMNEYSSNEEYCICISIYSVTDGNVVTGNIFVSPRKYLPEWDSRRDFLQFKKDFADVIDVNELIAQFAYPSSLEPAASVRNHEERVFMQNRRALPDLATQLPGVRSSYLEGFCLRQPRNPLALEFRGQQSNTRMRRARVTPDSVNCIALDENPDEEFAKFLVAGNVQVQNDALRLRHTTLMPKSAGYPELMCLMFSPCVELRCDRERRHLTGAICGLGYTERTAGGNQRGGRCPVHAPSDMEVPFDIKLHAASIADINRLRSYMNDLLGSPYASNTRGEPRKQEKMIADIRRLALTIVNQPWENNFVAINSLPGQRENEWGQIPRPFIEPYLDRNGESYTDKKSSFNIFQPIMGIKLND